MAKIVGIEFKEVGKIYWFSPDPFRLKKGDKVVVETIRGVELGTVAVEPKIVDRTTITNSVVIDS